MSQSMEIATMEPCPNGNSCLVLDAIGNGTGDYVSRQVDLSAATSASLTFDYDASALSGSDVILVEVRTGGGSWTTIDTYNSSDNTGSANLSLNSYLAADTEIRFLINGASTGGELGIDNLDISYDCNTNTGPSADYTIDAGGTINTCAGTFADSGNGSADYGDSETQSMTFCSDIGNQISFTFEHFNTEAGADILTIYDGADNTATSLGSFSGFGSANSPGVVTSSADCLTFEFASNGSTTALGWLASIKCTGTVPVTATLTPWTGYPEGSSCISGTEISGVAYEDLDYDGNWDIGESPIKDVPVTLYDDNGQVGTPVMSISHLSTLINFVPTPILCGQFLVTLMVTHSTPAMSIQRA